MQCEKLPSRFLGALYRWSIEQGICPCAVLANTEIPADELYFSRATVSINQHIRFIENFLAVVNKPCAGFEFGMSLGINALGVVGHVAQHCKTLGEAVEIIIRNIRVFSPILNVSYCINDQYVEIRLIDSQLCTSIEGFRMACFFSIIYRILENITQLQQFPMMAYSACAQPAKWVKFSNVIPFAVRFYQSSHYVTFPENYLNFSLPNYEPVTFQALCKNFDIVHGSASAEMNFLSRVKPLIYNNLASPPGLDSVAEQLAVSPRTLRRELKRQGVSFKALLDQERKAVAISYLSSFQYSVESISGKLGYKDPSSFTRAFKKWTGVSPSHYRRNLFSRIS